MSLRLNATCRFEWGAGVARRPQARRLKGEDPLASSPRHDAMRVWAAVILSPSQDRIRLKGTH